MVAGPWKNHFGGAVFTGTEVGGNPFECGSGGGVGGKVALQRVARAFQDGQFVTTQYGRAKAYIKFALANPGQYRVLFMTPGTHKHPDIPTYDITTATSRAALDTYASTLSNIPDVARAPKVALLSVVGDLFSLSPLYWSHLPGQ